MSNTTIKHTKLTIMALAMSTTYALPDVAGAADVYLTEMGAVETAIVDGKFCGRKDVDGSYKDQENLLDQHYHAVIKLGMGKYDDAMDKLIDISDKAYNLANAPKAELDDDAKIITAVKVAIACLAK